MTRSALFTTVVIVASGLILACCSTPTKPPPPEPEKPTIVFFTAQPNDILVTDSTQLLWRTENADSMIILPLNLKVATPDTGRITIIPDTTMTYTATAYNENGSTTLTAKVFVEIVPFRVKTKSGDFYKGQMGSSVLDRPLIFKVTDSKGNGVGGKPLVLSLLEGDGTLSIDSGVTDSSGMLPVAYTFDGSLGHAIVRGVFVGFDSLDIQVRADRLIPGASGQLQYILWGDSWANVRNFNGLPYSIDVFVDGGGNNVLEFVIANYEDDLGLVLFIEDPDQDGVVFDSSQIIGGVVADAVFIQPPDSQHFNTPYEGTITTPLGPVGVGTHYWDVFYNMLSTDSSLSIQFGFDPDTIPPWPAIEIDFPSLKLFFRLSAADSLAMQIEMQDPTHPAFSGPQRTRYYDRRK